MSFRENLRFIMDSKGIQTKELSQKTNISENTLKSYLKTDSAEPKISNAIAIAKALNVSIEFLITGVNSNDTKSSVEYKLAEDIHKLSSKELKYVSALVSSMISEK